MSYFDQIYSRLFPKDESSPSPIIVDEILKRSERFKGDYEAWKVSDEFDLLINDTRQSYLSAKENIGRIPPVLLHESPSSNGFAISFDQEYDKASFHFLFDYLADQVKKLEYRLVMSKQTLKEKGQDVERKEMHYLKPKRGFIEPIDQKYGNVQIEYIEYNDEPSRIKFIANSYPDRKYKEALSFESLAEQVLN